MPGFPPPQKKTKIRVGKRCLDVPLPFRCACYNVNGFIFFRPLHSGKCTQSCVIFKYKVVYAGVNTFTKVTNIVDIVMITEVMTLQIFNRWQKRRDNKNG